jgi:hypothetical protein
MKHCNVCKRTYPEDLPCCPHCADTIEVIPEDNPFRAPGPPSSLVDDAVLGDEATLATGEGASSILSGDVTGPPSSYGNPEWAAGDIVDDPSGIVIVEDAGAEPPAPPAAAGSAEPPAQPPTGPPKGHTAPPTQIASRSAPSTMLAETHDLESLPPPAPPPPAGTGSLVDLDLGPEAGSSAVVGGGGKLPTEAGSFQPEGVDLDADDDELADASSAILEVIDEEQAAAPEEVSAEDLLDEEVIVEGSSDVNLGSLTPPSGERPSGLDLVAEAVESGTDLGKAAADKPKAEAPAASSGAGLGLSEIDLGSHPELGEESSSVDLGSTPFVKSRPSSAEAAEDAAAAALGGPDSAGGGAARAPSQDVTTEYQTEAALEEEPEEEDEGKPSKPAAKPNYMSRWVGGAAIGAGLTGAAAAVLWYTGMLTIPALDGSKPANSGLSVGARPGGGPGGGPSATPLQRALEDSARGNYKQALTALGSAQSPEELSARAEARWRLYLQEQKEKNAPLNRADAQVAAVLKDVNDAQNVALREEIEGALAFAPLKARLGAGDPVKNLEALQKDKAALQAARAALKENDVAKGVATLVEAKKKVEDQMAALKTTLEEAKYVTAEQKDLAEGLKKLLAEKAETAKVLAALADSLKAKPDELAKSVDKLVGDKKAAEDTVAKVKERLEAAGVKDAAVNDGVDQLAKDKGKLEAEKKAADAKLAEVARMLEKKGFLGGGEDLVAGVNAAIKKASEPLVTSAKPAQMLEVWNQVLQERGRPDAAAVAERAERDAEAVTLDPKADAGAKTRALYITALALRNRGRLGLAKSKLEEFVKAAGDAPEAEQARRLLKEMTDAQAYYLPQAASLRSAGRLDQALAAADEGLKALPNNGDLLAVRSLVLLDQARRQGKLAPDSPAVAEARKDAAAAAKAGSAEGHFALGSVAEALGNWDEAEKSYRAALKAHHGDDKDASRYRLALARVLLRDRTRTPAGESGSNKSTRLPAERPDGFGRARAEVSNLLTSLILLAVLAPVAEDEEPASDAGLEEAIRLADEAIKAGNPEGYLIKGQALARKGMWTEGLMLYVTGLQKMMPGPITDGLHELVDGHPVFKRPDGVSPPNPLMADKHYAMGLSHFWARRYPEAEREFYEAVRYLSQDARYQYFLGLSRLLQGGKAKRDAAYIDFQQAYRLEQAGRPNLLEVNTALERVQGWGREQLDRFRRQPLSSAGAPRTEEEMNRVP